MGGDIIEPFRDLGAGAAAIRRAQLRNIVVVTLPQPMIVGMLLGGGIALGNLTLEVSRASGFYPDIVIGGAAPLTQLHEASIVAERGLRVRPQPRAFIDGRGQQSARD